MKKPYYQDEWVTIYHGNCREILPELPKVDLVLTDPPYVGLKGITYMSLGNVAKVYNRTYTMDDRWNANYDWIKLIIPICNNGLMVFCSYHSVDIIPSLVNFNKIVLITWSKPNAPPARRNVPHYTTEFIWVFKNEPGLDWHQLESFYTIDNITAGCVSTGERFMNNHKQAIHPTQKPEALISELLKVRPSTVLDPFLGTGTTAYCAKKLNIKCIGIEIEEKYCEIAANRCMQTVFDLENIKTKEQSEQVKMI